MPNDARRLASMVDAPQPEERGNLAFRKDFAAQTKALFESFGSPLAGMSDAPFADLLRTMASFPSYSLGNQSLIALQAPGAQCVSSASRWTDLGRRLVNNARAVHIWAPADSKPAGERGANGYARPSLERAESIALSLGLRATQSGDYLFDAHAVGLNALWGGSQTWRSVRAVRMTDGGDHIAVKLILRDGRALDRRARTMIGLVKTLMQAGASPNDETIAAYLNRGNEPQAGSSRARDFFQKFKLVSVYDLNETDGPEVPDAPAVDLSVALNHFIAYLEGQKIEVIVGDSVHGMHSAGEQVSIYVDKKWEVSEQFGYLLDSAAEIISNRRASSQNRELLKVECEAIQFVLAAHFGWPSVSPELGYGLAPNVEPHATADVVKARLVSIHDIAKELILAARPGYENPLLKALTQARAQSPAVQLAVVQPPIPTVEAPKPAVVRKLQAPKPKQAKKTKLDGAQPSQEVVTAAHAVASPEDFNPFASETVIKDDAVEFNPFAVPSL